MKIVESERKHMIGNSGHILIRPKIEVETTRIEVVYITQYRLCFIISSQGIALFFGLPNINTFT